MKDKTRACYKFPIIPKLALILVCVSVCVFYLFLCNNNKNLKCDGLTNSCFIIFHHFLGQEFGQILAGLILLHVVLTDVTW